MSRPSQLSWENFRSTVLVRGQQRVHRIADRPLVEIFGNGAANRVGIWLEIAANTPVPADLSRLSCISVGSHAQRGRPVLEVSTGTVSLQKQFYHFAIAVAERILTEQCAPIEAVQQELRCFTDLLDERPILGTDRQLGLLGELLFLERLMKRIGPAALDAWLGPLGEPHDFRVWINEFEVKTTIAPHRIHTVNGLEQLVASHGCTLYLVSVLLGPAGAEGGFSLADKVSQLSSSFSALPDRKEAFTAALDACGLHMADVQHYTRRFALRRPFGVATVDQSFPALSRPLIQRAIGPLATRIEGVHYEVNIEGLESEDGTPAFEAAFT